MIKFCEFKASSVYIASFRTANATQGDPKWGGEKEKGEEEETDTNKDKDTDTDRDLP